MKGAARRDTASGIPKKTGQSTVMAAGLVEEAAPEGKSPVTSRVELDANATHSKGECLISVQEGGEQLRGWEEAWILDTGTAGHFTHDCG